MTIRLLALGLALAFGLTLPVSAKTKSPRHNARVYKVKKSRGKSAKARKVKPGVRHPRKTKR
jgi:hypothetical protein